MTCQNGEVLFLNPIQPLPILDEFANEWVGEKELLKVYDAC